MTREYYGNIQVEMVEGGAKRLLEFIVPIIVRERRGLSYEQKIALITDNFEGSNSTHELRVGRLLEDMKGEPPVIDWFPTKKERITDQLLVDAVVLRSVTEAVCLQVTSTNFLARTRRRKIGEMYGEGAIGMLTTLTGTRREKSDHILRENCRRILQSDSLLTIEIE